MKKILGALTILTIIDPGFTGDKESEERNDSVQKPSGFPSIKLSDRNRTTLDAYHETDPCTIGHEKRVAERLHDPKMNNPRQGAINLIGQLCQKWYLMTRLGKKETRELLDKIYSSIETDGPDLERRMRNELLEIRPDLRGIEPEIIRTIVHYWYRSIRNEGRIRSREGQADLLYTYYQVKYGGGNAYDRLENKWRQFHSDMSNYNKFSLLRKAYDLSKVPNMFSPEEMEAARLRYERIFGSENPRRRKRMKWTDEQTVDLLYLTSLYKRNEITKGEIKYYWRAMHPEHASVRDKNLENKRCTLKRKNCKESLTMEEEAAAESRLKKILVRSKESDQNQILDKEGGLAAEQSFHRREFHQTEPDRMIHSSPSHNDYEFADDDWELLRKMMNEEASSNNLTTPNRVPFRISHSHSDLSTHNPYTVNPYYKHGSSSQSHYDPYTMNSYYEHGSSSHSRENGTEDFR